MSKQREPRKATNLLIQGLNAYADAVQTAARGVTKAKPRPHDVAEDAAKPRTDETPMPITPDIVSIGAPPPPPRRAVEEKPAITAPTSVSASALTPVTPLPKAPPRTEDPRVAEIVVARRTTQPIDEPVEPAVPGPVAEGGEVIPPGEAITPQQVREIWDRLLADPGPREEHDDSNLIFFNLLLQLTSAQARIINYACEQCGKSVSRSGFISARPLWCPADQLMQIARVTDLHRLDRELDHLRSLELLSGGGFDPDTDDRIANLTPTGLALNLYVRAQGAEVSPVEYFMHQP